jgi:hypothetical protein
MHEGRIILELRASDFDFPCGRLMLPSVVIGEGGRSEKCKEERDGFQHRAGDRGRRALAVKEVEGGEMRR